MSFVRVSIVTPKSGQEQRVEEVLGQLVEFCQSRQGCVAAYRLGPDASGSSRFGRISIWESKEAADHTAAEQHDISLQSTLKLSVDEATHQEYAFEGFSGA